MSRPVKKGLEYFPMDCHLDDEVNLIIADYGIEGFGVLVSMFQSIYSKKGYYSEWTIREQKLFSRRMGLDIQIVVEIINECIDWDIFSKEMYESHKILTSRRIQDHYSTATYKRTGVTMIEDYLMIDISSKKHINKKVSDDGNKDATGVSDDKSTQSKVQYSKVQYSKEKIDEAHASALKIDKELVLQDSFNQVRKLYPGTKTLASAKKKLPTLIKKHGKDQMINTIKRYITHTDELRKQQTNLPYMMESTFWNGRYEDYLDENYTVVKIETPKKQNNNNFHNFEQDEDKYTNEELEKMLGTRK